MDPQDSFRFYCVEQARLLAAELIDEKGCFREERLEQLIDAFISDGYATRIDGRADFLFAEHAIRVLRTLRAAPQLVKNLLRFSRPLANRWAESVVRDTVGDCSTSPLTNAQIRVSVLSACLTPLRQSVGSCFATAGAILIQEEQLPLLLEDLYELLCTGMLKRTFGGVEFVVPLSPTTGAGDLRKQVDGEEMAGSWALLLALEATGLIDRALTWERRLARQKQLLDPYVAHILSYGQVIRSLLLAQGGVDRQEFENFLEQERRSRMIRGGALFGQVSKRRALCEALLGKERIAEAAFKGAYDNLLLKAWEFTIASFSEVKMEFSKWNMYASLGLHAEEEGGIGALLLHHIEIRWRESKRRFEEMEQECALAFQQVKSVEVLYKQVSSDADWRRLQGEYIARYSHFQACLELRDEAHLRTTRYAEFFSFLIKQYDTLFPLYFQEIYDADMVDVQVGPYEDAPAGFRLVYKRGRTAASLWARIDSAEEYVEAICDFFVLSSVQVAEACPWEGWSRELDDVLSQILSHLRTPEFLQSAIVRMARAHQIALPPDPMKGLDTMTKKPWAYTSGGTMEALLRIYFCKETPLTQEQCIPEGATNLLIFILDVLKSLPPSVSESFVRNPNKGMLMQSPTHAFLLHPGWPQLLEGWMDEGFTYTWVRDQWLLPRQDFYSSILLSPSQCKELSAQFAGTLPARIAHQLSGYYALSLTVQEFAQELLRASASLDPFLSDALDRFLYQSLPLWPSAQVPELIKELLAGIVQTEGRTLLEGAALQMGEWVSLSQLLHLAKLHAMQLHTSRHFPFDLHGRVVGRARALGIAPPTPLFFADSNWAERYFGFVVSPVSLQVELWQLDPTGVDGLPMSSWKPWIDGSGRKPWVIYTRPHEYTMRIERFGQPHSSTNRT